MILELPYPPALNSYYRSVTIKGRARVLISRKGREYRDKVLGACLRQVTGPRFGDKRVSVRIAVRPPDRRRRDLDGTAKGVLDALTHAAIWNDDSQIDQLTIVRGPPLTGTGALLMEIEEIHPETAEKSQNRFLDGQAIQQHPKAKGA